MDILYVHPAKQEVNARYDQFIASSPYPLLPVGVIGLVNLLRRCGWSVEGINLPVELLLQSTFDFVQWLRAQSAPRLVMVDLHWYEHSFGAIEVARAVKSAWPCVPIVIGGLTATFFATEILERFPEVDYVVCGDAEEPLRLLASHHCGDGSPPLSDIPNLAFREEGKVHLNPLAYHANTADLDALDFVSADWLHHHQNYAALQYSGAGVIALRQPRLRGHWLSIGRGCVFNCIFCGGSKMAHHELAGREAIVLRSPERIVEEIHRLRELGFDQVALSLDPAILTPAYWRKLFSLLQNSGIRIGIYNEFFQLPSDEFLEAFTKAADLAHTEVAISPLSGHEEVRHRNGKFFSNQRLLRVLEMLKRYEVPVFIYFSLNLPGETPDTFRETLDLAAQIGRLYPSRLLRMLNSCHTLDPLSPMSRAPEAFGVEIHYRTFMDYYVYCRGTAWQPRFVIRGQHRGYEMIGRPAQVVEQMARRWDAFAAQQPFRCYPVPRGW